VKLILTAVITYLATSIDEIPVLFMLYKRSDNKNKGKIITVAYVAGMFLLIATGYLGAYGLIQLPAPWMIGLFGLIPLAMGVRILTTVLCIVSYQLTRIDWLTIFIERYERIVIGITFIGIGIFVILESGTLTGITRMFS
jgi:cadmium resistance protein CadD (predicted permease)